MWQAVPEDTMSRVNGLVAATTSKAAMHLETRAVGLLEEATMAVETRATSGLVVQAAAPEERPGEVQLFERKPTKEEKKVRLCLLWLYLLWLH